MSSQRRSFGGYRFTPSEDLSDVKLAFLLGDETATVFLDEVSVVDASAPPAEPQPAPEPAPEPSPATSPEPAPAPSTPAPEPPAPQAPADDCRPAHSTGTGFFVDGGTLYDATCTPFVMRGVNNTPFRFGTAMSEPPYQAWDNIASFGFNTVRVNWCEHLSVADLDQHLQRVIDLGMVPVVDLHCYLGATDVDHFLDSAVPWFVANAELWEKYEDYLILELANEFGVWHMSDEVFVDMYAEAITRIRAAGIDNTLVVNPFDWGKKWQQVDRYGYKLSNVDPQKNILFDIHFYTGIAEDRETIDTVIGTLTDKDVPFVIGEFTDRFTAVDFDHEHVMERAEASGVGYLGWSWNDWYPENGRHAVCAWEATTIGDCTQWGRDLIDGRYGVRATAQPAAVFADD